MPIERTRSTSPGRGPKAIRLSTWTIDLSPALSPALSTGPVVAAGLDVTRTAMVNGRTHGRNRFICEVRQAGVPERLTKSPYNFWRPMADLAIVEGPYLQQVLDHSYPVWHDGLSRAAYGRYFAGQLATPWGRAHLRRVALVDRGEVLASAKLYTLDASLDGRALRIAGIGALFTAPADRGRGHARALVERLLERSADEGATVALLFVATGDGGQQTLRTSVPDCAGLGFEPIATLDLSLRVLEDARRGAPMTLVRAGEDRDLPDVVAMGRVRAERYRFHLERDRDFVHFEIVRKRLLAGLGPAEIGRA